MMHSNQSAELWKAFIEQVFLEASDTQIRRAASRFQEPRMHEQAMRHLTGMGRDGPCRLRRSEAVWQWRANAR